jgi:signal transduction histidine kinase
MLPTIKPQWQPGRFISLRVKLLFGFTIVFSAVFAGAYGWFYTYSTDKALARTRADLVDTLNGTIAGIDGDEFEQLAQAEVLPGQDVPLHNPLYRAHQDWLHKVHLIEPRAIPYTFIRGSQPYEVLWIGDGLRIIRPAPQSRFRESYIASQGDINNYRGLTELTVTLTPYSDPWGHWVSAYAPIENSAGRAVGGVGIDFQANYMLEVQRGIRRSMTIAFALSYGTLFILVYLISGILTRPLSELATAAQYISEGADHHTLAVFQSSRFRDEINTLAEMFERMVDKVSEREKALQNANSLLEAKVADRTQELQERNSQLEQTLLHLQRTQAQLIQTEKMSSLGQLVAGIAHEINNPLNFIQSNADYANEYAQDLLELLQLYQKHRSHHVLEIENKIQEIDLEFLQQDLPKTLMSMRTGSERIDKIVQSLRSFSRLDEAELKEVDVQQSIESILLLLQSRLKLSAASSIEVVRKYDDLPLVYCYAGQLNQVFMHVLSNAIDALQEKHLQQKPLALPEPERITIHTQHLKSGWVTVQIADNGIGMTEAVRKRLFDPFFTTKPIGKGTGLGMTISHQIVVERHGGHLRCSSTPEQGTEFTIEIPVNQARCST